MRQECVTASDRIRAGEPPYDVGMSPNAEPCGSARSAAQLNEEIRTLWARSGGQLSPVERREYEALVVAWAAAVLRERATAPGHDETAPAPRGSEGRGLAA